MILSLEAQRKTFIHVFLAAFKGVKAIVFMHYPRAAIILFKQVCTSAYESFGKLVFQLPGFSVCSVLWIWCHLYSLGNICAMTVCLDVKCSVILF